MSKKTYINIGGSHFVNEVEYITGSEITTEQDLAASFPEKFRLVEEAAKDDSEDAANAEDVTSDFPLAAENDLIVNKAGKIFTIMEEGEPVETEKPITSKKAVTEFLKEYTEE